jgi:integrase
LARIRLTDKFLRTVTAKGDGRDEFFDAVVPQMVLRISPSGHKSLSLCTRFPGSKNPTRRLLGTFYDGETSVLDQDDPDILDRDGVALSLAEARQKARVWLGMIARGRDPGAEKRTAAASIKAKEAAAREAAKSTFERVAAQWVSRKAAGLAHELEIERLVEREFSSRWQGRPIAEITRDDYRLAIREIAERAPAQARNALGHLRRLLSWADECGAFGAFVSPLRDVKPAAWIDQKKQPRARILSPDELRAVWQAAAAIGYPWDAIVHLLIMTGQRVHEISDLSWPEVDLDAGVITIPASRMKGGAAHEVPLAPRAAELLQNQPRWDGKYLFSLNGGTRPVAGFPRPKKRLDAMSGVTGWVLHDLRRTARTHFSALPFETEVREAVLDHHRAGIERVYNLHEYAVEKRALLTAWEERLAGILEKEPAPRIGVAA